jgi:DNA-binding MarR family transcriptional regulator
MSEINEGWMAKEAASLGEEVGRELSARTVLFHQAVADRLGIGITDHKCLDIAHRAAQTQTLTAGMLAEETGLTTGAITGVLDRLEKAGFIRREKHPTDRRQVVIRVLDERAHEFDEIFGPFQKAWTEHCSRYGHEQLAVIRDFVVGASKLMTEQAERLRREGGARRDERSVAGAAASPPLEQSAPLGGLKEATLVITRGAAHLALASCDDDRLYRASFGRNPASIKVDGGRIELSQKHGFMGFATNGGKLELSERLRWSIVVRGGAHRLECDLRRLHLVALDIVGGTSETSVRLPPPSGTVAIKITGGISKLRLLPPAQVPFRLLAKGGCSQLVVDRMQLGAVGGALRWESPEFATATDRYDFEIRGGASDLSIVPDVA